MGGIFIHGRFYVERNRAGVFLQFFFDLTVLSRRDSRPVCNKSSPHEISHHWGKQLRLPRKNTKTRHVHVVSPSLTPITLSHIYKAIVSILPPFSSDGSGFAYLFSEGFE